MLASTSSLPFYICSAPYQPRAKVVENESDIAVGYSPAGLRLRWKSVNGNAREALRPTYKRLGQSSHIQQKGCAGLAVDSPEYDLGSALSVTCTQGLDDDISSTVRGTGFQDVKDPTHDLTAIQAESKACNYSFLEESTSKYLSDISNDEQIVQGEEGKSTPANDGECQCYGEGKLVEFVDDATADSKAAEDNQPSVASPQDAFEAHNKEEKVLEEAGSSLDGKQGGPKQTVAQKVTSMHSFRRKYVSSDGILIVQVMKKEHLKATEELLADSFAELMWGPLVYKPLLAITVRGYLREKVKLFPNTVTLVGFYAPAEDNMIIGPLINSVPSNWLLAGTVEVSFSDADKIPTVPPLGFPYLCNMAVDKRYRRQGIGWQLLRAAEELAAIKGYKQMHLHCRVIDSVPLRMYKKAGYRIIATDSIWILLSFQRRRHLMVKSLETSQLAAVD